MKERVVAIVPVGALDAAKSRLGAVLDAEERRDLVVRMLVRTVEACIATPDIAETLVISPDLDALAIAAAAGARTMRQRTQGLNAGLGEARDDAVAGGATAVLVLPIDLPLIGPPALEALLGAVGGGERAVVALVPDRHGRGTNALLIRPPDAIAFAFGGDSRDAHAAAAGAAGARFVEVESPMSVDLDTPDDLLLLEELAPEVIGAG
jgi:2-phospho-L-lactate/phosphoenolpyruvate guanylyltransferase